MHTRGDAMFNATSTGTRCTHAAVVTFTKKYRGSMWPYDFLINPSRSIKNSQARVYVLGRILSPRGQNAGPRTCAAVLARKSDFSKRPASSGFRPKIIRNIDRRTKIPAWFSLWCTISMHKWKFICSFCNECFEHRIERRLVEQYSLLDKCFS